MSHLLGASLALKDFSAGSSYILPLTFGQELFPVLVHVSLGLFDHPLVARFEHVTEAALKPEILLHRPLLLGLVAQVPHPVNDLEQRPDAGLHRQLTDLREFFRRIFPATGTGGHDVQKTGAGGIDRFLGLGIKVPEIAKEGGLGHVGHMVGGDDLMRPVNGDDYGIACCVSAMKIGKQMQFFGARCNLPKLLLLALNGGYDTYTKSPAGPEMPVYEGDILDFDTVMQRFEKYREWICRLYINTLNVIHYMHDKYAYEKTQMALHDTEVERFMACGAAGLSVLTDSLSAIKYARVKVIRDENGYIVDFETQGEFPTYGNDDDRADEIARNILADMSAELKKTKTYRDAVHTLSVLTITSNVMYGKKTGATPDGRKAKEPFAPGANPMHNREKNGALASLNSVAKLSYEDCRDGISNTFSITPDTLGRTEEERLENLVNILDGYFRQMAHHVNVNVINRAMLMEAYENPAKYPNLTIRVSGYAVNFHKLSREQQKEVIMRTFHEKM